MNRHWTLVFVAGLFEIVWVIGLKHAEGPMGWTGTAAAIFVSMILLIQAAKRLPTGTAYAVFTGIGTAGTVLVEMLAFGEPFRPLRLLLIALLLGGVIGLKAITKDQAAKEARE